MNIIPIFARQHFVYPLFEKFMDKCWHSLKLINANLFNVTVYVFRNHTLSMLDFALDVCFRAQLGHESNEDLIASFGAEHLPEILFI